MTTIDNGKISFLWGGKIDKIRRDVITRRRELGGLDLFNGVWVGCRLKKKKIMEYSDFPRSD